MKLLLHACCGPCSTHVAEVLSKNREIVGYFYNPNIYPYEEWLKRYEVFREVAEKSGFFADYFPKEPLSKKEWEMEHQKFLEAVKNLENEPEGNKRCPVCFKLRLEETAKFARELRCHSGRSEESRGSPANGGINSATRENLWFAATLTIGRNKKAEIINPIGESAAQKYGVKFYAADFKKQDGFLRSVKLSKEMGIYRQKYCGCEFSFH